MRWALRCICLRVAEVCAAYSWPFCTRQTAGVCCDGGRCGWQLKQFWSRFGGSHLADHHLRASQEALPSAHFAPRSRCEGQRPAPDEAAVVQLGLPRPAGGPGGEGRGRGCSPGPCAQAPGRGAPGETPHGGARLGQPARARSAAAGRSAPQPCRRCCRFADDGKNASCRVFFLLLFI